MQIGRHQSGSNRDAIGSWIEVRRGDVVMRRGMVSGGGRVSRQASDCQTVDANGFYHIMRGEAVAAWEPGR